MQNSECRIQNEKALFFSTYTNYKLPFHLRPLPLAILIDENRAKILGPIRQEVLSGYSDFSRYEKLRHKLRYFPNEQIIDLDYESAAEYANLCRKKGIQGSHTDFLICAVSIRLKMKIYTNDRDFIHYSNYLPISLHNES